MRPTHVAEILFRQAFQFSSGEPSVDRTLTVLNQLAQGLMAMNLALRQTYVKLDELDRQMKAVRRSS